MLSAPSGAGKTTLTTALRHKPDFVYSVSCTTRNPRSGEIHGEDYFFLSEEEFQHRAEAGEFLEFAEVHNHHYGTLRGPILESLGQGVDVLIDIDIKGAEMIRRDPAVADALADVFIMPPSLEELARRLQKRGTETESQIAIRLQNAAAEIRHWRDYRYTIISGSMEEDIVKFRAVMRAERYLSRRLLIPEP
ncbi:MAG: guanylate kinase [Terrimicrobiaceae bacterium]